MADEKITINSETMVFDKTSNCYVPKWQLETAASGSLYRVYYFSEKKNCRRKADIYDPDTTAHIKYLQENRPAQLKYLIDSGKIYIYLRRFERRARLALYEQLEQWQETEQDYLLTKANGDFIKEQGLLNNMTARAEEIIQSSLVCD